MAGANWREKVETVKSEIYAVYLAGRDVRTPWYAKLVALLVTAYAFSPIDLVPDFIPVLGYLDDLLLVPVGIYLSVRLIPTEIMAECRREAHAAAARGELTVGWGALVVIAIWLGAAILIGLIMSYLLRH